MSGDLVATAARFAGLQTLYDRFRPSYPREAIAAILAQRGAEPEVVDIGAGTGIATRLLAATGARTIGIEPNAEMRAVALARGSDVRDGTASATGLPDRSADVVTAFQAFHWFAHAEALAEFRRLLRDGGRIALVWNERDTRGDAYTREVRAIERRFGDADSRAGMEFVDADLGPSLERAGFAHVRRLRFENDQHLDRAGLIGRVRSTSYAPRTGARLDEMLRALDEVHDRYCDRSGHASLRYTTDVIIGERS
ncbi:MAG: class I SAM-dependent methyltransferase [Vulcanimicrobiaceae bacterium]